MYVPTKKGKNLLTKKCPVPEKCLSSTSSPFGYYLVAAWRIGFFFSSKECKMPIFVNIMMLVAPGFSPEQHILYYAPNSHHLCLELQMRN